MIYILRCFVTCVDLVDGGDDFLGTIPVCLYAQEMRQRELARMPLIN